MHRQPSVHSRMRNYAWKKKKTQLGVVAEELSLGSEILTEDL